MTSSILNVHSVTMNSKNGETMNGETTTEKPERRNKRGPTSVVDLNKTLSLIKSGFTYEEIGKLFGVGATTVLHQVQTYINDGINLDFFKQHRADIFASKQAQILKSLSQKKIEKATAYQLTGMMGILYDKERLERGQSTQNIAYADMSREMKDMDKEIKALEADLGELSTGEIEE